MNYIKKMAELQDTLNAKTTGKNWRNDGNKYDRALRQEAAEAMDSLPWKWWKDIDTATTDAENLIIEAIDMLHFALSDLMVKREVSWDFMHNQITKIYNKKESELSGNDLAIAIEDKIDDIVRSSFFNPDNTVWEIFKLFRLIGLTYEDVYKIYIGKNVLNTFRQDHGYKEGFYTKQWFGHEDNVFMMKIVIGEDIDIDHIEKSIYGKLKETYRKVLEIEDA